jgi:Ni/Co efflux regulator RcnB
MKKLLTTTLFALSLLPVAASAATSPAELRRDRQDIREEQRDVRQAVRSGDRRDIRDERGDVRDARREYRQDLRDRNHRPRYALPRPHHGQHWVRQHRNAVLIGPRGHVIRVIRGYYG